MKRQVAAALACAVTLLAIVVVLAVERKGHTETISSQAAVINELEWMVAEAEEKLYAQPKLKAEFGITVTSYTSIPILTDSRPWETATGDTCSNQTLALSRDLLENYTEGAEFAYGDTVWIVLGPYIVEDTTNERHSHRADLWLPAFASAVNFGIHRNCALLRREING